MLRIIGIGHKSGHGKDTVARLIDTDLRIRCPAKKIKVVSFADKLKDVTREAFGYLPIKDTMEYNNNRKLRSEAILPDGRTVVDLWVQVGEKLREIDPSVWVKNAIDTHRDFDIIIIPDVRHPNEVSHILDDHKDNLIVKIERPDEPPRTGLSIDNMLDDYTGWSDIIINDGTLRDLNKLCVKFCDELIDVWGLNG